jgi:hypothetical protein
MALQIHFTPEEIAYFLRQNGFTVEPRTFGRWETRYHNQSKWVEYTADAVVIGEKQVKAADIFQHVVELSIKGLCTPINEETKQKIENTFKNHG